MKRNILIALFTLMLGFTGTVNARDVAISSYVEPGGSGAWIVIKNQVYYCAFTPGNPGELIKKCWRFDLPKD